MRMLRLPEKQRAIKRLRCSLTEARMSAPGRSATFGWRALTGRIATDAVRSQPIDRPNTLSWQASSNTTGWASLSPCLRI